MNEPSPPALSWKPGPPPRAADGFYAFHTGTTIDGCNVIGGYYYWPDGRPCSVADSARQHYGPIPEPPQT